MVKEVFAASPRVTPSAWWRCSTPDVVFIAVTGGILGRTEPYRGHEGMREYFRDVERVWDELILSPGEFEEIGDAILVTGRVSARSPARTISGSTGWVWRVRDGLVVHVRVYRSASEAAAAVRSA